MSGVVPEERSAAGVLPGGAPALRVLLVEDDAGDALLVEEMLIDTGMDYTLRWRQSLADALSELRTERADCVLLDLRLPDVSGIAGVTAVLEAAPEAAVLVLTGLAESDSGVAAVAAGAQDYLVKGKVGPELLQRALRYAVHRKQAERAAAELRANRVLAEENARLERGLLPRPLLHTPAARVLTRYVPGRERALLSGDFLDVVQTEDGIVHAVIGDVSGHGPDQAALGVCLRITWRALTLAGHVGGRLLTLLEQILVAERTGSDLFATCSLLSLDLEGGTATVVLAGHHGPLITADGKTTEADAAHGIALGIAPGLGHWYPTTLTLPPSGALTLYTDGLIEGHAGEGDERLGATRLVELMGRITDPDPDVRLDRLLESVRALDGGRHTDDLAILQLLWGTPAEGTVPEQRPAPAG
ncbi:SpoIIE family protein phosphatase [Streptomyces sp. DSM 44917]|uniref:SpoIIE family protein phosphatase n=1 Tax=Streptomyces boetiae TaxID=3075541 RepID=A0ABU2LCC4_9ACTN|nr:SpoIIE family protein phosphatase [Streptomyces sp. DSM 44917]MDT0309229.1 SpoIIE family protein phosphatase [Streptomyces sp. DSM 44917]